MYKIMIVEDALRLYEEIQEALLKWGFNPVIVKNFEDILNEFVQNKPELVIMDINLPCFYCHFNCISNYSFRNSNFN